MDLRRYLFDKRISITQFSKNIGCSREHITGVISKKRIPSLMLAKLIEKETNGEVTVEELMKGREQNG